MILHLYSNAQRGLLVVASGAVALILSYFSIRNALAAHYAGLETPEGYERATHLEPTDPRNWYLLGRHWQYNLEDPDAARAIRSYLSALSLNPGSSDTWLDLAAAYESEGNLTAARDAFLHAKKVYRSEEHTSELQSLAYLVCRLLLEKKKKQSKRHNI